MRKFTVSVTIEVEAPTAFEAAEEVRGLLDYAFEVSNDEERFKSWDFRVVGPQSLSQVALNPVSAVI